MAWSSGAPGVRTASQAPHTCMGWPTPPRQRLRVVCRHSTRARSAPGLSRRMHGHDHIGVVRPRAAPAHVTRAQIWHVQPARDASVSSVRPAQPCLPSPHTWVQRHTAQRPAGRSGVANAPPPSQREECARPVRRKSVTRAKATYRLALYRSFFSLLFSQSHTQRGSCVAQSAFYRLLPSTRDLGNFFL